MLISERENATQKMQGGPKRNSLRTSSSGSPSLKKASAVARSRAPMMDTFKAWLCAAKASQRMIENRRDLAALQMAHEEGATTDQEVRNRASLLVERELNQQEGGLSASKHLISRQVSGEPLDSTNWYAASFDLGSQGRSGKLLGSRSDRNVTLYFCLRRTNEVFKYTLAFTTPKCAADFIFALLGQSRHLARLNASSLIVGSQGLYALSVSQSPEDRKRADTLMQKVVPKQLKSMQLSAKVITRWWRSNCNFKGRHSPLSSSPEGVCNMDSCAQGASFENRAQRTPLIHRRTKTLKITRGGSQSVQQSSRRAHAAASKIQRAFRAHIHRQAIMLSRVCMLQKHFRRMLHRKRAAEVIVRFAHRVLYTLRRRRSFALGFLEARENFNRRVTEDIVTFYYANHQTMLAAYPFFNNVIDQVRECALKINPKATLEPFGSSVTGLALPSSDLDMVICFQPPHLAQYRSGFDASSPAYVPLPYATQPGFVPTLANGYGVPEDAEIGEGLEDVALYFCKRLGYETDWVQSARVVGSATQPVIKLECHPRGVPGFGIHVDITFWHPRHTGIQNSRLIRDYVLRYHPQVGPLVLIIKQYLREHRLNSVYGGGMSSISLAVLVWVLVRDFADPLASLGEFLLHFFATFGEEGFFAKYGVNVKDGIFPLSSIEERQQDMQPPALIEDPLRDGNNLAMGMYRVAEVSACFRQAYRILAESKDAHPLYDLLRCRPVPIAMYSTRPMPSTS